MAADAPIDAPPTQHRVLRQITEAFGRHLERGLKDCLGRDVPVHFGFQEQGAKKPAPHVTAINYWVERVNDRVPDRVLCRTAEGEEYFRAAPLLLVARYAVTAWAPPPEDAEILAGAVRVLHDDSELKPSGEGDEDAVHWEDRPLVELSTRFTLDEARALCASYGMPFRPTMRYDITFRLDSERKTPIKRVKERIVDFKKLDG